VPGRPLQVPYLQAYLMNADGTAVSRLTNTTVSEGLPVFSPDGQKIMFTSATGRATGEIYVMNLDGTGRARVTNYLVETVGNDWR
jgi:TolB protein